MLFLHLLCKFPSYIHMLIGYDYLSGLGALQGILLAILLVTRRNNRHANKFLSAFIMVLIVSLTERFYQPVVPGWFSELLGGLLFLYGPLVVLYIKALLGDKVFTVQSFWHVAGFGLYIIILLVFYLIIEVARELIELILAHILFVHLFFYSYLSLSRLFLESRKKEFFIPRSALYWLKVFTVTLTGVYGTAFIGMYLRMFESNASNWLLALVQIGCVAVVYGLSYWSLVQPDVNHLQKETSKYSHSGLSETDKENLLHSIFSFIAQHKPYLQPTFTLEQFAKSIGTNRFYISQVINECTGKNFSDFINTYRIEEAKRLLSDSKKAHYSMVGVGYEAGFNSKTAFNTAFKKLTGQTPTEYRKWLQKGVPIDQTGQLGISEIRDLP